MNEENDNKTRKRNNEKCRFQFLEIYWEVCQIIPDESRLSFIRAVIEYGLYGKMPDFSEEMYQDLMSGLFALNVKPFIDKYFTYRNNGRNGGPPKGNKNASKTTEKQPKTTNQ